MEVSVIRSMNDTHRQTAVREALRGGALRAHEQYRRDHDYPPHSLAPGTSMVPFVCDVLGGLGPESTRFFGQVAARKDVGGAREGGGVAWDERWRRDMSIVLARETARTLVTRVDREAQGVHPTMVASRGYRGRP